MNSKPMRNDSDRVAPDRGIRLPGRTPVRSRRRIAAGVLSVLLGLSCFAASPARAYKAGNGADDTLSPPEFANVAAYLAVPYRHVFVDVKIGRYTLKREDLEAFHKANTLTDAKLIASFADTAAYLADSGRTNRLYAYIGNKVYRVTDLEAARIGNTIPTLPNPVVKDLGSGNTAVGDGAKASEYYATAIGVGAAATDRGAVAIGFDSRAHGWKSVVIGAEAYATGGIAIGRNTRAHGDVIALGKRAKAHGSGVVSLGTGATALGDGATAVGSGAITATESGLSMNLDKFLHCIYHQYVTASPCRSFLTPAQLADPRLTADTAAGKVFRAAIQRQLIFVLNGRSAHAATALGSNSRATARDSTALGHSSWAAGIWGSTAVGSTSRATGNQSTALGAEAKAGGLHSTAVGEGSEAHGADTVAVGGGAVAGGLSSGKTYDDVAKYLADPTRTGSTNVQIGKKVYRVTALEAVTGLTKDNLPVALTATAGGVAVGVSAAAAGLNSIALGQGASATGSKGIAIGSDPRVSAGQNEVVIGTTEHTYKLPGLATTATTSGTRVVTVDSNGRLSTQAATSSSSRGASLRGAAALSAEVTALNRDTGTAADAADYEEAPAIGSGPGAPATAEQRRVVVQDTNRDGSVRLRTLDFGDLSGVDRRLTGVERRVTTLSERLNKATAMSAALSALPNVVPGDKRFFLGVGAGHYSSEQAVAIGMSARVGRHVFVNAGAAVASGDNASVRGGVGVVW